MMSIYPSLSLDQDNSARFQVNGGMTNYDITQRGAPFDFDAGPVFPERRDRGLTLVQAAPGIPVARQRAREWDDLHEIL